MIKFLVYNSIDVLLEHIDLTLFMHMFIQCNSFDQISIK